MEEDWLHCLPFTSSPPMWKYGEVEVAPLTFDSLPVYNKMAWRYSSGMAIHYSSHHGLRA